VVAAAVVVVATVAVVTEVVGAAAVMGAVVRSQHGSFGSAGLLADTGHGRSVFAFFGCGSKTAPCL
jgi:hypothetical protein